MAKNAQPEVERRIDDAYAAMSWPFSIGVTPSGLLAAYVNYATGASLATLGLISTIARVWDVGYSPLIGVISDRTRTPYGRRKPWTLIGFLTMTALLLIGMAVLPKRGDHLSTIGFTAGLLLFLTAITTGSTAHTAHSGEVTTDYDRRSRMNVRQGTIHMLATLIGLVMLTFPITRGRHRIILRKIDRKDKMLPELLGAGVDPSVDLTA